MSRGWVGRLLGGRGGLLWGSVMAMAMATRASVVSGRLGWSET